MSTEENKAVIRQAAEAVSNADFDALDELMAPDVATRSSERVSLSCASPSQTTTAPTRSRWQKGDMVAGRFIFYGTHEGEFMGVAPTGRQVIFRGLSLNRLVDGEIVEAWIEIDLEDISGTDRCRGASGTV